MTNQPAADIVLLASRQTPRTGVAKRNQLAKQYQVENPLGSGQYYAGLESMGHQVNGHGIYRLLTDNIRKVNDWCPL